jgi:hypothetical protein
LRSVWSIGQRKKKRTIRGLILLPIGTAINPIVKSNWEGKGVTPDVSVPKETALNSAYQTALQHLLAKKTDQRDIAVLNQALAVLEAEPQSHEWDSALVKNSETQVTGQPSAASPNGISGPSAV